MSTSGNKASNERKNLVTSKSKLGSSSSDNEKAHRFFLKNFIMDEHDSVNPDLLSGINEVGLFESLKEPNQKIEDLHTSIFPVNNEELLVDIEKVGVFEDISVELDGNNQKQKETLVPLLDKKGYLLDNFGFVTDDLSDTAVEHIYEVVMLDKKGDFIRPVLDEPSIYDQKHQNETVDEFVRRLYPNYPATWSKTKDGDIIPWIKKYFQKPNMNFIDDTNLFTRRTLRKLNPQAATGLKNWLAQKNPATGEKNRIPDDLPLPKGVGSSPEIIKGLSIEQINAAYNFKNKKLSL